MDIRKTNRKFQLCEKFGELKKKYTILKKVGGVKLEELKHKFLLLREYSADLDEDHITRSIDSYIHKINVDLGNNNDLQTEEVLQFPPKISHKIDNSTPLVPISGTETSTKNIDKTSVETLDSDQDISNTLDRTESTKRRNVPKDNNVEYTHQQASLYEIQRNEDKRIEETIDEVFLNYNTKSIRSLINNFEDHEDVRKSRYITHNSPQRIVVRQDSTNLNNHEEIMKQPAAEEKLTPTIQVPKPHMRHELYITKANPAQYSRKEVEVMKKGVPTLPNQSGTEIKEIRSTSARQEDLLGKNPQKRVKSAEHFIAIEEINRKNMTLPLTIEEKHGHIEPDVFENTSLGSPVDKNSIFTITSPNTPSNMSFAKWLNSIFESNNDEIIDKLNEDYILPKNSNLKLLNESSNQKIYPEESEERREYNKPSKNLNIENYYANLGKLLENTTQKNCEDKTGNNLHDEDSAINSAEQKLLNELDLKKEETLSQKNSEDKKEDILRDEDFPNHSAEQELLNELGFKNEDTTLQKNSEDIIEDTLLDEGSSKYSAKQELLNEFDKVESSDTKETNTEDVTDASKNLHRECEVSEYKASGNTIEYEIHHNTQNIESNFDIDAIPVREACFEQSPNIPYNTCCVEKVEQAGLENRKIEVHQNSEELTSPNSLEIRNTTKKDEILERYERSKTYLQRTFKYSNNAEKEKEKDRLESEVNKLRLETNKLRKTEEYDKEKCKKLKKELLVIRERVEEQSILRSIDFSLKEIEKTVARYSEETVSSNEDDRHKNKRRNNKPTPEGNEDKKKSKQTDENVVKEMEVKGLVNHTEDTDKNEGSVRKKRLEKKKVVQFMIEDDDNINRLDIIEQKMTNMVEQIENFKETSNSDTYCELEEILIQLIIDLDLIVDKNWILRERKTKLFYEVNRYSKILNQRALLNEVNGITEIVEENLKKKSWDREEEQETLEKAQQKLLQIQEIEDLAERKRTCLKKIKYLLEMLHSHH